MLHFKLQACELGRAHQLICFMSSLHDTAFLCLLVKLVASLCSSS